MFYVLIIIVLALALVVLTFEIASKDNELINKTIELDDHLYNRTLIQNRDKADLCDMVQPEYCKNFNGCDECPLYVQDDEEFFNDSGFNLDNKFPQHTGPK